MNVITIIIVGMLIAAGIYVIEPPLTKAVASYVSRRMARNRTLFEELFIELPRWQIIILTLAGPILAIMLSVALFRTWWLIVASALILLVAIHNFDCRIIHYLKQKRMNRIKAQLMDALGMVSSALRSGLSLQQGFGVVAEEIAPPLAQEFRYIMTSQQLGRTFDQALAEFARRVPLEEVTLLVSSLAVLREAGGNVIETLDVIISTISEERRVRDKIKTLTTQGIVQAVIISALPFFLAAALYLISPQYIMPLFIHPVGWGMLGLMLFMQGIGIFIMKKIVTIKV